MSEKKRRSDDGEEEDPRPSPLDFDQFVPWACAEFECPVAIRVNRTLLEERKKAKSHQKLDDSLRKSLRIVGDGSNATENTASPFKIEYDTIVLVIYSMYDANDRLVEIRMNKMVSIPLSLMQVICLAIPCHHNLNKFLISGNTNQYVIHELKTILMKSTITEIVLDDTKSSFSNYYILLDECTSLKHLSLSRCMLNDCICKMIATRLIFPQPASKCLIALNLASNLLTDDSAMILGTTLRTNRQLQYLNLADNDITDVGFSNIILPLGIFPLTILEIKEKRMRRLTYLKEREELLQADLINAANASPAPTSGNSPSKKSSKIKNQSPKSAPKNIQTLTNQNEVIDTFDDPFTDEITFSVDGYIYCYGNMALSYLNVSYNDLEYPSVVKLRDLLIHQSTTTKSKGTGLLKINIEGTNTPKQCSELIEIDELIERIVSPKSNKLSVRKK